MGKYKTVTKNVDKGVSSAMVGAVMNSLYDSDEYLAKKAKTKARKPVSKAKAGKK